MAARSLARAALLLTCLRLAVSVVYTDQCQDDELTCDATRCLPPARRCDGVADCFDRTDELNCEAAAAAAAVDADADAGECVIELSCRECVPEGMPLVESHRAAGGAVRARAGATVALACRGGRFRAYPLHETLRAVCEAGRYRVAHDNTLRHLLELGCQDEIFEDVLHDVSYCAPPHQGRAYQMAAAGGARHVAAVCSDGERALPRAAAVGAALPLPPHADRAAPRSLLANFNQMFEARTRADAERLYADEARLQRRVLELLRHAGAGALGDQRLAAAALLAPEYFEDQDMRVADFSSNHVAVWRGVAAGNLRHLQLDVAGLLAAARGGGGGGGGGAPLAVWAGTHGVAGVRTAAGRRELFLQPGRFPVPKYLWTVVHDRRRHQAVALVVLNEPLVAVSEVRAAVLCESACARLRWPRRLLRARNYECPALGLVFCCPVHELAAKVEEVPAAFADVPPGAAGLLAEYPLD